MGIDLDIKDFPNIDDKALTYSMNLNLGTTWTEPRILIDTDKIPEEKRDDALIFHADAMEMLWKPDLFIRNLVKFEEMKVNTKQQHVNKWVSFP